LFSRICFFEYLKYILFSLRVNTPLLAALLLEISFVEIPRSLLRGVSLLFFGKVFKGISRKYKNFTREHGQTITQVPKKYFAQLRGRIKAL